MADIAAWAKLKPNFCEVERETLAMTERTVEPCLNSETALILGVHPIVNCCDVNGLIHLAQKKEIPILFDSVESAYETTSGGRVGSFGKAEIFSLHASKFINGFEGGYATTNDPSFAKHLRSIRTFGFHSVDNVSLPGGMNAKLNEIHAAMALANLDDVHEQALRNRERYSVYKKLLMEVKGLRLLEFDENYQSGYKNIVVEILDEWPLPRKDTIEILNAENILARAYYYPPLHQKKMQYPFVDKVLPLTTLLAGRFINLPCGHFVNKKDIEIIVNLLLFLCNNYKLIKQRMHR